MVIDQFVYDPNAGTGKIGASLDRGVFRFVGGKLSKQDNAVTMRTPTATIGIRGGVMLVRVRPDCTAPASLGAAGCNALQVIFVYGKGVTVTGLNGASQTLTRPGFEVTVSRPGASPSDPGPAPPGATAAMLAQLDGRAGGNGGAPVGADRSTVTNSGIANVISANVARQHPGRGKTQPILCSIADCEHHRAASRAPDNLSGHLGPDGVVDHRDANPGAASATSAADAADAAVVAAPVIPIVTPPMTADAAWTSTHRAPAPQRPGRHRHPS